MDLNSQLIYSLTYITTYIPFIWTDELKIVDMDTSILLQIYYIIYCLYN